MRTTVTLEPDVVAQLKRLMRAKGLSFKDALNQALRAGLSGPSVTGRPVRFPTYAMGQHPGVDLTKALRLAAELEDEEIARKLAIGTCSSSTPTCSCTPSTATRLV
ncbi:MAG: CopG family transcriptional regulator [Myxococcota bacterium]